MQFSIKKIGMIALASFSIFHIIVHIRRRIKDVHLLFAPQREEERKIFEN